MKLFFGRKTGLAARFWRGLGLGVSLYLIFSVVRGRFLLSQSREIAVESASFDRDYFLGEPNARPLLYVVLGDSTAAGWGAGSEALTYPHQLAQSLAARSYRVRVVSLAVGGARVRDVIEKQLPSLQKLQPGLISLSVGANDATHFTSQADYSRDLGALLAALKRTSARQILVANTPDMFLSPALPLPLGVAVSARAHRFNAILEVQTPDSRLQIVDIFGRGKIDYRRDPNLYAADLFHPSARGYRVWAQLFIEATESRLLRNWQ